MVTVKAAFGPKGALVTLPAGPASTWSTTAARSRPSRSSSSRRRS